MIEIIFYVVALVVFGSLAAALAAVLFYFWLNSVIDPIIEWLRKRRHDKS